MTDWDADVTQRIAGEIKRQRGQRSGQWLADRTKELGHAISKTAIWEIEAGKRKSISVPELLIIARALEVPPTLLLFPGVPDRETWALPNWHTSASVAEHWFIGDRTPAPITGGGDWEDEEAFEEIGRLSSLARVAGLSRRLESARWAWLEARSEISDEGDTDDMEKFERLAVREMRAWQLVRHLESQVEDLGGEVSEDWRRYL
ncbi:DNA-binding protein [Dietzia sp. UCD-THP]|uniref:helix-turn-helix domain-containing protein n=1 Tax=Dietzia sp. UCD-THP TaxID=1292020 RepID=UPI00035D62DE|nr:hypothetical protein [Dietzia sp. UCD-THP]EYT65064.1 DNA-binding protein [Dietzia sp. UCD-THP]